MAASDAKREGMRVCWPEHGRAELAPFSVPDPKPGTVFIDWSTRYASRARERRSSVISLDSPEAGENTSQMMLTKSRG